MEIACTGKVPSKPYASMHCKSLSTNAQGRRRGRMLEQVLQSKCTNGRKHSLANTNGMPHSCANGRCRIRLRKKCADRFMYATDAIKHIRATATTNVHS